MPTFLWVGVVTLAVSGLILMSPRFEHGGQSGLIVYTDTLTGCQYLRARQSANLTPRLNEFGFPLCNSALKDRAPLPPQLLPEGTIPAPSSSRIL